MTTYLLLPGSDGDVRVWERVVARLQANGCEAICVSLAGLQGERIVPGLATQVALVQARVGRAPETTIPVGYSYSGLVASEVARHNPGLPALIYVDAIVPQIGRTPADLARELSTGVLDLLGGVGQLPGAGSPAMPVTFITCTGRPPKAAYSALDRSAEAARTLGWTIRTMPTGHHPMTEDPETLTTLLLEAGSAR